MERQTTGGDTDGASGRRPDLAARAARWARAWANRVVDDPAGVDDVVQETVIVVLDRIGELRHPEAFVTWVRLITRSQAARHRRARRPQMTITLELLDLVDPADGPERSAERHQDDAVVRRALWVSSDQDRLLLELRYWGEWTDTELAGLLGISAGAVRKRLHDARARMRRVLLTQPDFVSPLAARTLKESQVNRLDELFGSILHPDDIGDIDAPISTLNPWVDALTTGLKVLDAVIPWPRGGTVDIRGPVGLGQLVVISEIAHNLGPDTGAVVAVASTERAADNSSGNLHKLVDPQGIPEQAIVIRCAPTDETRGMQQAGRIAGALATQGRDVLLVVDRTIFDHQGADLFVHSVGFVAQGGSVTGLRLAGHTRNADPVAAWTNADAETVFGIEAYIAGRLPAIDVLASTSALIDQEKVPSHILDTARRTRDALERSVAIQAYLNQPLWMTEDHTGRRGLAVEPTDASNGLTAVLAE
jgi:RNA polymerase sigma factor (sigma-70 family)